MHSVNLGGNWKLDIYSFILTTLLLCIFLGLIIGIICYKKLAPGDTIVIYGFGGNLKIISGPRGCFFLPVLFQYKMLSREVFPVKFEISDIIIKNKGTVTLEGTARLKLKDDENSLKKAATAVLSKTHREKLFLINTIIEESARLVIKGYETEKLIEDNSIIANSIAEHMNNELERIGYELQSFTISSLKDKEGYLLSLRRRVIAEEKAKLAIEEAYITREGKNMASLIRRDSITQSIGINMESNIKERSENKLDMEKVMENTEDYLNKMKLKLKKGVMDIPKNFQIENPQ